MTACFSHNIAGVNRWKAVFPSFFLLCVSLFGHDVILPDEEAPPALISASLGDSDVELFLEGSWKASVGLSGSWGTAPGTAGFVSEPFPGLTQGFLFSQSPDIMISLLMMNRFLFEASFIEGYELNTFLLGYQGAENELLKSVRIGNTETGISPFPYISISDPAPDSLGAAFELGSDRFSLEGMLRYDSSFEQEKLFRGHYEISESRLSLTSFIRGTYFILPGDELSSVEIYVEDAEGNVEIDGRTYRTAGSGDFSISYETGEIVFDEARTSRILALYDSIPWTADTGISGTSYEDFRVESGSTDYLILYDPGRNGPCERYGFYQLSPSINASDQFEAVLVPKGEYDGSALAYLLDGENAVLQLQGVREDGDFDLLSAHPLMERYPGLYGENADPRDSSYDTEILVESMEEIEESEVPSSIISGSLVVYRNGSATTDYVLEDGVITFTDDVGDSERIRLTYRTTSSSDTGADILSAVGSVIKLGTEGDLLKTGIGFRWNTGGGYAETEGEHPGSLLASAEISGARDTFSYYLRGGVSLSTSDTTGKLRLFGMEENRLSVPCSDDTLFPSSVPTLISGCTADNRGILLYRNYRLYSALGGVSLMSYNWEGLPEDQSYPYETWSRPGPYAASPADDDPFSDTLAVFDYILDSGEWAGGLITLSKNEVPYDLSNYTSFSFSWKLEDGADPLLDFYVEIGAVGEDLDDDGVLDAETSVYSSGFPFNDGGSVLLIGGGAKLTGNDYLDSEDLDGNGVLDTESAETILTLTAGSTAGLDEPDGGFGTQTISLTGEMRSLIKRGAAIRIVIVNGGTQAAEGRLLVGDIAFSGGSFSEEVSGSGSFGCTERDEEELETVYAEVADDFHSSDEEQRALEIAWGDPDPFSGTGTITGYTTSVEPGGYGSLVWYMKVVETDSPLTLSVALTDSEGNGVSCDFTADSGEWTKYRMPLAGGSLVVDGKETSFEAVDASDGSYSRFTFSLSGSSAGSILIDEVHLADPVTRVSGAIEGGISYTKPGTILGIGDIAVLSDFSFSQDLLFTGAQFAAGFRDSSISTVSSVTETAFTLLSVGMKGALCYDYRDSESLWGGSHEISLPVGWIEITDSFAYRDLTEERIYEREDTLSANIPGVCKAAVSASSALVSRNLQQLWEGSVDSSFKGPFALELGGELKQLSSDFEVPESGYFASWIAGFSQLLPVEYDSLPKRYGDLSLSLDLETVPIGLSIAPVLGYEITVTEERIFTTYGRIACSVPFAFSVGEPTEWGVSIGYSRNFSSSGTVAESATFASDIELAAGSVAGFTPFYSEIPIAELFAGSSAETFASVTDGSSKAAYQPELSMDLYTALGSNWYNLLIPNTLHLSLGRQFTRKGDTIGDTAVWNLTLRTSLLNLFGKLGRYPILPFYRTEEIVTSAILESEGETPFSPPETLSFVLQHYLTFLGGEKKSLTADNKLEITDEEDEELAVTDEISLTYSWFAKKIPLPQSILEKYDPTLLHEEIAGMEIADSAESDSSFSLSLLPEHRMTLKLEDLGDVTAYIGLGFHWEESGEETLPWVFITAVYGGIEVDFSF